MWFNKGDQNSLESGLKRPRGNELCRRLHPNDSRNPFSFTVAPQGVMVWEGKANSRSFGQTCASNECVFVGSWRDVPYKYAALRVLTQCTRSLKAGMSDRAPLRFPHLSFIRLELYPARFTRHLPHAGKTVFSFRCLPHGGRRYSHFPPLRRISPLSFIPPVPYPPLRGTFPGGVDDTRETCYRRPSGIARFILRRSRHHTPEP